MLCSDTSPLNIRRTKGLVWVNGQMLGRYWSTGPQGALYCPATFLHAGDNDVLLLEMDQPGRAVLLSDTPDLG